MNEDEYKFLYACIEDMIDGHWKVAQALLKLQRFIQDRAEQ